MSASTIERGGPQIGAIFEGLRGEYASVVKSPDLRAKLTEAACEASASALQQVLAAFRVMSPQAFTGWLEAEIRGVQAIAVTPAT